MAGFGRAHKTVALARRDAPSANTVPGHKSFRRLNASLAFFFTVIDQFGIFCPCAFARFGFSFLGPIAQNFLAELSNLFHSSRFGFVSTASFSDGLIDQISDQQQTSAKVWSVSEAFIEAWLVFVLVGMVQIVFHELLNYTRYLKVQAPNCLTQVLNCAFNGCCDRQKKSHPKGNK